MSEGVQSRLIDLTKQVVPVASLVAVAWAAWLVAGFKGDTATAIEAARAESKQQYVELSKKLDDMREAATTHVTNTEFDNWRLRMQWANRTKDIDFSPELRR